MFQALRSALPLANTYRFEKISRVVDRVSPGIFFEPQFDHPLLLGMSHTQLSLRGLQEICNKIVGVRAFTESASIRNVPEQLYLPIVHSLEQVKTSLNVTDLQLDES